MSIHQIILIYLISYISPCRGCVYLCNPQRLTPTPAYHDNKRHIIPKHYSQPKRYVHDVSFREGDIIAIFKFNVQRKQKLIHSFYNSIQSICIVRQYYDSWIGIEESYKTTVVRI